MDFLEKLDEVFTVNEAVTTTEIVVATIHVRPSQGDESNILVLGSDRAAYTPKGRASVHGASGGDPEYFVNLDHLGDEAYTSEGIWKVIAKWIMDALDNEGYDPILNPEGPQKIYSEFESAVKKNPDYVSAMNREQSLRDKLSKSSKIKAFNHPSLPSYLNIDPLDLMPPGHMTKDIEPAIPDPGNIKIKSIGNSGFLITPGIGGSTAKKQHQKMGITFILDILTAPSLGRTVSDEIENIEFILKENPVQGFEVSRDADSVYISTMYSEPSYPENVYVGPESETVIKLEKAKDQLSGKTELTDQEATLLDRVNKKLESLYAQGEVVDPSTEEGRDKIRQFMAASAEKAKSRAAKKTAEQIHDDYIKVFKQQVIRIANEAVREYGIPETFVFRAILSYLRKYGVNIETVDDFAALSADKKSKAIQRLKKVEYVDMHGLWEGLRRYTNAIAEGNHQEAAIAEGFVNYAFNSLPISTNDIEDDILMLKSFRSHVDKTRQYLLEHPEVYGCLLALSGHDHTTIERIFNHYAFKNPLTEEDVAEIHSLGIAANVLPEVLEEANDIKSMDLVALTQSKMVKNVVPFFANRNNSVYLEDILPQPILAEDGFLNDWNLMESMKFVGLSISEVFSNSGKNTVGVRPEFLVRLS